jgi:hypothetical protein
MSAGTKRFALLHHILAESEHWDLMLETGDALSTWQVLDDPYLLDVEVSVLRARPIGDHRLIYLDYEGPVSGDRGHVRRVDGGGFFLLVRQEGLWTVRLEGLLLNGTYILAAGPRPDDLWEFHRLDR